MANSADHDGPQPADRLATSVAHAPTLSPDADGAGVELSPGTRVARYVILERLGAGGMGVVYKAYDPQLGRRIALKVLRVGAAARSARSRDRLLREAQALAQLSHPNVIAVYDVDVLSTGEGFVAMELVEGVTLKRWLRLRRRSNAEIVQVFLAAGRGLAAAHRAGLIHRDFKPENVLVGDDGRVRVVDFGLARAAGEGDSQGGRLAFGTGEHGPPARTDRADGAMGESTADTSTSSCEISHVDRLTSALTQAGTLLGTPGYMAPEQYLHEEVDEATDQFAFCVTLFEALYRQSPHGGKSPERRRRNVIAGRIRQPPADVRVPARLRRIAMRGMSVARADRYPSMEALLAELARNPRATALRVAAALGVAGLVGLAAFGLLRDPAPVALCQGAADQAADTWNPAVRQAIHGAFTGSGRPHAEDTYLRVERRLEAYAQEWERLATRTCEATHRHGTQSERMLDLRMYCLNRRRAEAAALTDLFANQPSAAVIDRAVEAVAALTNPAVCGNDEALLGRVALPSDSAMRSRTEAIRENLDRASALYHTGGYREAAGVATAVLSEARAVQYAPLEADAARLLAEVYEQSGDYFGARALFEELVRSAARASDPELVAVGWIGVMRCTSRGGRPEDAIALRATAEVAVEQADSPRWLQGLYLLTLGIVHHQRGEFREARAKVARAIVLHQAEFGPDHPEVALVHNALGAVCFGQQDWEAARVQFERALAIRERALGPYHPAVAVSLNNVAAIQYQMGDRIAAMATGERAIAISERVGAMDVTLASTLGNLGSIAGEQGDFTKAHRYLSRSVHIFTERLGEAHPHVAQGLAAWAEVFRLQGNWADACDRFERSLAIANKAYSEPREITAQAMAGVADCRLQQGGVRAAAEQFEHALEIARATGGSRLVASVEFGLARATWQMGIHRDRALAYARDARARLLRVIEGRDSSFGSAEPEAEKIDAWLAERR